MKIVCTIPVSSRASVIGDAVKSVKDLVDVVWLHNMGLDPETGHAACVEFECVAWRMVVDDSGDMASIRNRCIDAAEALGGDWCLMLDSDERLEGDWDATRNFLKNAETDCVVAMSDSGEYAKERFIRCGSGVRYVGSVHEYLDSKNVLCPHLVFSELAKSPEQLASKCEFVIREMVNDGSGRYWYCIGDAMAYLGRSEEAIAAFDKSSRVYGACEEGAWSSYRAATLDEKTAALYCWQALLAFPAQVEAQLLLSTLFLRRGNRESAILWAKTAQMYSGTARHWYRLPFAHGPGPDMVLREAVEGISLESLV